MLYEVDARDPLTFVALSGGFLLITLATGQARGSRHTVLEYAFGGVLLERFDPAVVFGASAGAALLAAAFAMTLKAAGPPRDRR